MRNNFGIYHPAINFIYFSAVIVFSVLIMNPVFLGLSLICAFIYAVSLKGTEIVKFALGIVVPLIILSAVINPLVNHRGENILFELPWGLGPVTMESVLFGFTTGLMIGSVIMWFVCFNTVITSDKLTYLFGKILPGSSLIFIMILRFIPRYREHIKKISEAQQAIGKGVSGGPFKAKIINGVRILSIMFTWALENAIQTADSMRSRGYGLKNRTSFMIYKITGADKLLLLVMIILIAGIICAMALSTVLIMGLGCICFVILALIPVWLEIKDAMYWKKAEAGGHTHE